MRAWILFVAAVALPAAAFAAAPFDRVSSYANSGNEWIMPFEGDLRSLLNNAGVDEAAAQLAPRYGLSKGDMRQAIDAWIDFMNGYFDTPLPEAEHARLLHDARGSLIELYRRTHNTQIVLLLALHAADVSKRCSPAMFEALTADEPDMRSAAWTVAANAWCSAYLPLFEAQAPKEPALLVLAAEYNMLPPVEQLALLKYNLAHFPFGRLSAVVARTLRAHISGHYLILLLGMGLVEEADRFRAGLTRDFSNSLQAAMKDGGVTVDGLRLEWGNDDPGGMLQPMADAAVAYVLKHDREARAAFAAAPAPTEDMRTLIACRQMESQDLRNESRKPGDRCWKWTVGTAGEQQPDTTWMMLDLALNKPQDDAYPMFELAFATVRPGNMMNQSGLWLRAAARLASSDSERTLIARHLENVHGIDRFESRYAPHPESYERGETYLYEQPRDLEAALGKQTDGAWRAAIPEFEKKFANAVAAIGAEPPAPVPQKAATEAGDGPLPWPYREATLPANLPRRAAPDDAAWRKTVGPLPLGYHLVRLERDRNEAVAVSLSQNINPSGEVTMGGYWIHRSHDGGKTWDAPLYTGLADHWPYMVVTRSRLPLIAGNRLMVEVENAELDLSSITLPPVGLRSKRRVGGIYLEIPIAELTRDSDGDGLTDILETQLLLSPHNVDSDADGIPDGRDLMPNVARSERSRPTDGATLAVLEYIFGGLSKALVEPVDRSSPPAPKSEYDAAPVSFDRPMMILGSPAEYGGLRPTHTMLVYTGADLARLRRYTPNCMPVSVGLIVLDRSGDRGFMTWANGYSASAWGLRRINGVWKIHIIAGWIT